MTTSSHDNDDELFRLYDRVVSLLRLFGVALSYRVPFPVIEGDLVKVSAFHEAIPEGADPDHYDLRGSGMTIEEAYASFESAVLSAYPVVPTD